MFVVSIIVAVTSALLLAAVASMFDSGLTTLVAFTVPAGVLWLSLRYIYRPAGETGRNGVHYWAASVLAALVIVWPSFLSVVGARETDRYETFFLLWFIVAGVWLLLPPVGALISRWLNSVGRGLSWAGLSDSLLYCQVVPLISRRALTICSRCVAVAYIDYSRKRYGKSMAGRVPGFSQGDTPRVLTATEVK